MAVYLLQMLLLGRLTEKSTAHQLSLLPLAKIYYNQECPSRVDNGMLMAQGKDERAAYSM